MRRVKRVENLRFLAADGFSSLARSPLVILGLASWQNKAQDRGQVPARQLKTGGGEGQENTRHGGENRNS
jgi:hypothetical protein